MGLFGIHGMKTMNQNIESLYHDRVEPIQQLTDIRYAYSSNILAIAEAFETHSIKPEKAVTQIEHAEKLIDKNWNAYKLTYFTPEEVILAREFTQLKVAADKVIDTLKKSIKNEHAIPDNLMDKVMFNAINPAIAKINELVQLQIAISNQLHESNEAMYKFNVKKFYFLIIVSILFANIVGHFIVRDNNSYIKDFKENNDKIKESEEKYRYLFQNAPSYIIVWDLETLAVLEVNDIVIDKYGYNKKEWETMSVLDYRPKEDHEKIKEFAQLMLNNNELIARKPWRHVKKNGEEMEMEIASHKIIYKGKKAILSLANDVTEQRKFQAHQLLMTSIVNSSDDAIISKSNTGIITSWNLGAEKILGYQASEMIGQDICRIIPKEMLNEDVDIKDSIRKGNSIHHYKTKRVKKNGDIIDVSLTVSPIMDTKGKVVGASKILRDVTKEKQTEAKLAQQNMDLIKANAELDRFVYSASHDLRAPLKSLLGLIAILKKSTGKPEQVQLEMLNMMHRSVIKLDDFIEEILQYSQNSRMEVTNEAIPFEELVKEILESHKFSGEVTNLNIQTNILQQHPFISDKRRIIIVLSNIISNAIKYRDTSKGDDAFIKIHVQSNEQNALITVKDNGIGIDAKDHQKIFEMFYRATNYSTGSGIGMYIVKEALEKLNGKITIESALTEGTKFIIELPNQPFT
jgi:PAS domain S-box-containing protein